MKKLPILIVSLLLVPAVASAQPAGPPPPAPDDAAVENARPPGAEPDVQPPAPPAVPPSHPQASASDQVGILQQGSGDGVGILQGSGDGVGILQGSGDGAGILQGSGDDTYREQPAPAAPPPRQAGQWVYTSQYGWAWMPYGSQYVDEGAYGAASPYQYLYTVSLGWSWCAAPWLWGWGTYPYFGVSGPSNFAWYRGLYRAGYGWGRYRGGSPRVANYGGGYRTTRPIGGSVYRTTRPIGGNVYRTTRPIGGSVYRTTRPIPGGYARPSVGVPIQGRVYTGAPARSSGSFSHGGRIASGGARSGPAPHAGGRSRR